MRGAQRVSLRQMRLCAFVAALSLWGAGTWAGWSAALWASPAVLLSWWACARLSGREKGAAAALEQAFGRGGAAAVYLIYIMYALCAAAFCFSRCAERLSGLAGGEGGGAWLLLPTAALAVWMASGKPAALARAAELWFYALCALCAGVLLLALPKMNWRYALLGAASGWRDVLRLAGLSLFAPYCAFLSPSPVCAGAEEKKALRWAGALCLLCAALSCAEAGVLSPALAARREGPFFLMTAALGGALRPEGLASALWLMTDGTAAAVLSTGVGRLLPALCGEGEERNARRWSAGAAVLAWLMAALGRNFMGGMEHAVLWINPVLGCLLPAAAALLTGRKGKDG